MHGDLNGFRAIDEYDRRVIDSKKIGKHGNPGQCGIVLLSNNIGIVIEETFHGSNKCVTICIFQKFFIQRRKLFDRLSSLHPEDNFLISQEVLDWCPHDKDEGLEVRRSQLRVWMCLMLEYYRDALLCKVGAGDIGLFNSDAQDNISTKARRLSVGTIMNIMDEIEYSLEGLQRNANINLLVENMFTRIARLEAIT